MEKESSRRRGSGDVRAQADGHPSRAPFEPRSRYRLAGRLLLEKQTREVHIARFGDLDVAVAAHDHANVPQLEPFDQAGFIRSDEIVAARRLKRLLQNVVSK